MTEPFAPIPVTYAGSRYRSMIGRMPSFSARSIARRRSYASGVRTSSNVALAAAIVSGFPLNVPAMS